MLSGQRLLMADIHGWQYRLELTVSEEQLTGRHLLLVGVTRETMFLPRTELNLEIDEAVRGPRYPGIESADGIGVKLGEMALHQHRPENDLPTFIHGSVTVSPDQFNGVMEMLESQSRCNALSLHIQSSLYGLDLGGDGGMDRWPEGKTIFVTDLKFTLTKPPMGKETAD